MQLRTEGIISTMSAPTSPKIRLSITELQERWENGDKAPLELLMRAWKRMKDRDHSDPMSFFALGGLHGEPFRGEGATNPAWWGGYCQHGTVLFPVWHRAYLANLEKALQSAEGCSDVTLPFWGECSTESQSTGIPWALTRETFFFDGMEQPNPLRSFVFPVAVVENPAVGSGGPDYSKPAGYETVRYPLSGLVGPDEIAKTKAHNAQFPDYPTCVSILDGNITTWLNGKFILGGVSLGQVHYKFASCLDAPTYTLFSNTTSATNWNDNNKGRKQLYPLESPHNYMHLAVGGYEYPGFDADLISGANGDMGENNTAGLDPIFFFHHCFIDYTFWIWQRRHGATHSFDIDSSDFGAKYNSQVNPPPAYADMGKPMTMDTPLLPFNKLDGSGPMTARDCVDVEAQLGYTYGPGSLDSYAQGAANMLASVDDAVPAGQTLRVSGINRAKIRGSFLISAFATVAGKREYLGTEAILSRWNVEGCMNCQNHLEAKAHFRLPPTLNTTPGTAQSMVHVEVRTHDGLLGGQAHLMAAAADTKVIPTVPFKIDIY